MDTFFGTLRFMLAKPNKIHMIWCGMLLLTMFMTPGVPDAEVASTLLEKAVIRSDLTKSGIIRASHVMAAYWRGRVVSR